MALLDLASARAAKQVLWGAARNDFYVFQRLMQRTVSAEPYVDAPHLRALAWKLQQVADGKISRLGVAIAPRHFKSFLTSVAFPAFLLGRDPSEEIICASYGVDLSEPLARMTRQLMLSPEYQAIFPHTRFTSQTPAAHNLQTTKGGYRFATSVGGPVTGIGARTVIADDLLKADEAGSQAARDKAYDWLENSVVRITKQAGGRIVVPAQRLHVDDPLGRMKATGAWSMLELPAQFSLKTVVETGPGSSVVFQPGDVLFPERFGKDVLASLRSTLTEARFNAQYLQQPTPPGGHIFKLELFKRFDLATNNKKSQYEALVCSIDPGVSSSPSGDPSAITVWGIRGKDVYLLSAGRGNWTFSEQMAKLRKWRATCHAVLIERSHSGIMLVEELTKEDGPLNFVGFTPRLDKEVRAENAAFAMERGHIYLPHDAPFLEAFEQELAAFPHGSHDDYVDSMSQFFRQLAMGFPHWLPLQAYKSNTPEVNVHIFGS